MAKTPSEQLLEERRDVLYARGVPEPLIEKLATRKEGLISAGILATILAFSGIGSGGWLMLNGMDYYPLFVKVFVDWRGYAEGAYLFSYADWQKLAFITLFFSFMALPTWLYIRLTRRPKPYPAYSYVASCLRTVSNGDNYPLGAFFDKLPHDVSEEKLLLSYSDYLLKTMRLWIWGSLLAGLLIIVAGHEHYWGLYGQKIVSHSFGQKTVYDLKDVQSVTLGCNEASDSSMLIYKIHFPDKAFSLDDGDFGLDQKTLFERLETTDKTLRQNPAIRFERWQHMKRDPMAAKCLKTWVDAIGPNGEARINTLLSTSKRP